MEFYISEKAEKAGLIMEGALAGDKVDKAKFFEALSSGEISPSLLQAPLTARVIDKYTGIEPNYEGLAVRETVDDFTLQEVYRFGFDDEDQILDKNEGKTRIEGTLPRVGEFGEYQSFGFSFSNESYRAYKSGIKFALSWESVINGRSLRLIEKATTKMAEMARMLESTEVYGQYLTPSGLNTANLSGANLLAANPALSFDSLELALAQAQTFTIDGHRRPVGGGFTLVVSPSLENVARKIIATQEIRTTVGGTTTISGNPLSGRLSLKVADEILRINSAADDFWFLVPDLNGTDGYRPELWFVRGNEAPKFFVKSTTVQAPDEGDFDHDAWETKLRHTATGVNTGMLGVVASTGAGS